MDAVADKSKSAVLSGVEPWFLIIINVRCFIFVNLLEIYSLKMNLIVN